MFGGDGCFLRSHQFSMAAKLAINRQMDVSYNNFSIAITVSLMSSRLTVNLPKLQARSSHRSNHPANTYTILQ